MSREVVLTSAVEKSCQPLSGGPRFIRP